MKFLILTLAVWRFSSLMSREAGPFGILDKLRYAVGVRWNHINEPYGTNELSRGLLCLWCSSVWWGGLVGLTVVWATGRTLILSLPLGLALSGGAIVIDEVLGWLGQVHIQH